MDSWTSARQLVRRAARLTPAERRACLRAGSLLAIAAAALRVARYRSLRAVVERLPSRRRRDTPLTPSECAIAVARASRIVPGATCLARAIAAAALLRREGYSSTLTIGVALSGGGFEAHAWLDAGDARITGTHDRDLRVLVRDRIPARP